MSGRLAAALGDFRAGHDEAAFYKLCEAADMPDICSDLFQTSTKENPIDKENTDAYYLSNNAQAISMEVLHPAPGS
jgi:hypothetical protein